MAPRIKQLQNKGNSIPSAGSGRGMNHRDAVCYFLEEIVVKCGTIHEVSTEFTCACSNNGKEVPLIGFLLIVLIHNTLCYHLCLWYYNSSDVFLHLYNQRFQIARGDLFYTTKKGDKKAVFAFRIENVPQCIDLSFTKKEFVDAVVFGKLGVANTSKTIGNSHKKATLVFMAELPNELQDKLKDGMIYYIT